MATAVIINDLNNKTKSIKPINYSIATIKDPQRFVEVKEILPFRVKFTAIQIQDIRGMIPAIPLQVIGYSNYIL
jgi:hypothetical protein